PRHDDVGLRQVISRAGIAEDPDRLLGAGDLGAAARGIEVGLAQLRIDLCSRDALRLQRGWVEDDPDLAVDAAFAGDGRDAVDAEQALGNRIVDVPAELLKAHVGRFGGDEQDRVAGNVDPVDLRLKDTVRQVAPDLGNRVANVVDRTIGRRADFELDVRAARAFAHKAVDLVHSSDTANRGLDFLGDLRFHFGRSGAGLRNVDFGQREI